MSTTPGRPGRPGHPAHGQIGYLQLPAVDVARSAAFYEAVFGWSAELTYNSFEAPGVIGQFVTDRPSVASAGPVLWLCTDDLMATLNRTVEHGGTVHGAPALDQGERLLVEIDDPAGNRLGVVGAVRPPQPQPLLAVRDVEASSRWYQALLGLRSDHGGPHYERLLAGGTLVLQLHHWNVEHHHGRIGDPDQPVGNGSVVWFGEVADFDEVAARAASSGATILLGPVRNPPTGQGNGPAHRELWIEDLDGYTVVIASPDGEAFEP